MSTYPGRDRGCRGEADRNGENERPWWTRAEDGRVGESVIYTVEI